MSEGAVAHKAYAATPTRMPVFLLETGLRLLLFGGKGGVGKTTCAVATALYLSARFPDDNVLLVSTDPAHSLRDSLGESVLPRNLEPLEIDSRECLRKFKEAHVEHLRQIALRGTFLDNEDVSQLLDLSMPGLDEVMAFNEISTLVQTGVYSRVIVDTAPTGHTLRLLELPETLNNWLRALDAMLAKHRYMVQLYQGSYRKDEVDIFLLDLARSIENLSSLLRDSAHCRFVPVMLPECLSTNETMRLVRQLEAMRIPVTDILVNRVRPLVGRCPVCRSVADRQSMELETVLNEFSSYSVWGLPLRCVEARGAEQLSIFFNSIWQVHRFNGEMHDSTRLFPRVEHPAELPGHDISLLIFAGKGGVGKTTLACATALRLAREYPDKRILLLSTDPAHSLSDCLNTSVGAGETPLRPCLTAVEIDAVAEFEELKRQYGDEVGKVFDSLAGRTMIQLEFDQEVMKRMLDLSPPGLDEVMALTRAMRLLQARKYDIFVFDTAPTGHLIRLLELPEIIEKWLKVFFGLFLKYREVFRLPKIAERLVAMSKEVKLLRSLLADPQKGQIYAVSILTEMALEETRDLLASCAQTGIRVPALFLNLVTSANDCPTCHRLAESESRVRRQFDECFRELHQTVVFHGPEPRGGDHLSELGQVLYEVAANY
ncbi:ArsA family ATPase [Candidatus Poribacteria bacterium]|nr:ArsA family ATPase [Candidatus Poribacteria bacterium]